MVCMWVCGLCYTFVKLVLVCFGIRFSSRFVGHVVLPDVLVGRPLYIEKIKIMKRPNDNRWIPDSLWRKGLMPQSAGQKTLADINTTMYRHDLTCTGQHKHHKHNQNSAGRQPQVRCRRYDSLVA